MIASSGTITIDTTKLYIATPEGGQIKNGAVCDKDGKTAYMVAIKPHEEYNVWVGSTRVTGGNADDILGNGKASYSAATKTLTLNDLRASDLEGLYTANNKTSYIYTKQDPTITNTAFAAANKTNTKYNITLKKGASEQISFADVKQRVMFKSNKGDIAYVDEYGTLRAQKTGKCKITAKINGKTYTINVTVSE